MGVYKIYSLGKCYSDSPIIVKEMEKLRIELIYSSKPERPGYYKMVSRQDVELLWEKCLESIKGKGIDTIIILDDGGRALEAMPPIARFMYRVAGIEQTRGGLYVEEISRLPFPVIEVASSALKRFIEPPFIAKAIMKHLDDLIDKYKFSKNMVYGVIGNGVIGSAITKKLISLNFPVMVFDNNQKIFKENKYKNTDDFSIISSRFYVAESLETLIANSQCIFSCTGKDITQTISLPQVVTKDTFFISCSSEDKEFLTALQNISNSENFEALDDLVCKSNNGKNIIFVRGGYPFHFDNQPWNVPAEEIEPTQAALFGAFIQAVTIARKPIKDGITPVKSQSVMLSPSLQAFIVQSWCNSEAAKQHSFPLLKHFENIEWIIKNSGASLLPDLFFKECLFQEVPIGSFQFRARL